MSTQMRRHGCRLLAATEGALRKVLRAVLALSLISAGCGGGGGSYNGPYPADVSGSYTFTLSGYPCGPSCQPLVALGFSQTAWSNRTNTLTFGSVWSIYNFCWNTSPPTSAFTFSGNVTVSSGQTETLTIVIQVNGQDFVTLTTTDFSKLTGTWTAGPALVTCSGSNGPLTWTAQKFP